MGNNGQKERRGFISYINDNNEIREGYVDILEQTENYIKFKTKDDNIITISYNRLIKLKEKDNNER